MKQADNMHGGGTRHSVGATLDEALKGERGVQAALVRAVGVGAI